MSEPEEPPGRWPRDSEQEAAEAHRHRELGRLERWAAGQRVRPLAEALTEGGLTEEPGEGYAGPLILPEWWAGITEPASACPWCQRPASSSVPCPECQRAHARTDEPASVWQWWASLQPAARRLNLAARYGLDPWQCEQGQPEPDTARCRIELEWLDATPGGEVHAARLLYAGAAPAGIYWGTRAAES